MPWYFLSFSPTRPHEPQVAAVRAGVPLQVVTDQALVKSQAVIADEHLEN